MLRIKITEAAAAYLKEKTDVITVKIERAGGGWACNVRFPAVYAGKPDNVAEYNSVKTGDFRVYVEKSFPTGPEGLIIDLKGFGIFKRLSVEGVYL